MNEWRDPHTAGDPAAEERERRRAEREARRREREAERRSALGDRVRDAMSGEGDGVMPTTGEAPVTPPPSPPASGRAGLGGGDVYRRRRAIGIVAAVVVAALVVVGLLAVAHHFAGGGGSSTPVTAAGHARSVTIPEGYDRAQIAEIAKKDGLRGDYEKASRSVNGFDPSRYGARDAQNLEGFLFPATYDLPRKPTVDDLVVRQLSAFKVDLRKVDLSYAKSKNLTPYDVLIIASIIEREVEVPSERADVAAVVYNRLHAGMPLQIDATIRYAENNYTKPLTNSDLQLDSPYNTYRNPGLPPGPIGNPGLDAMKAAAKPADVPYLYYVVKPDTCGEHFFTDSYKAFQQASQRYDSARQAAGGQSPTSCPSG
jgi:hypothetical protein